MRFFTAKEARKLSLKKPHPSYQTQMTLSLIEKTSKLGGTSIIPSLFYLKLYEEDVKFLENLGYDISFINHSMVISW